MARKRARSLHAERLEVRTLLTAAFGTWTPVNVSGDPHESELRSKIRASEYRTYSLNREQFISQLEAAPAEFSGRDGVSISLPKPDGLLDAFTVFSSPVMAPELAARYPEIRTFVGQGLDDPSATLRLDITPAGVHGQVLGPNGAYYVDPFSEADVYASYLSERVTASDVPLISLDMPKAANPNSTAARAPSIAGRPPSRDVSIAESSGTELRVYRTAIAATAEYTQFHGGSVSSGLAAVVSALNRITGIYETELSIRLELVANNDQLIYTNQFTDPYTNSSPSSLIAENQANVDNVIGLTNYDIGHVFGTEGGGLAFIGSVGQDDSGFLAKAQAASGIFPPTGDAFFVNIVSHEIGHQFGGNHTWNGDSQSCSSAQHSQSTAYEPGSGSTILSYAGICGNDNLQEFADPFFHSISFDQIIIHVDGVIPNVGTRIATGNSLPQVDAGPEVTIPAGTPFFLQATGSDADTTDALSYSWEQRDLGPQRDVDAVDGGSGPLFRAWPPTAEEIRVFPRLTDLLNNTTATGETLPSTNRDLNFQVTVRDNRNGGGGVSSDSTIVHVVDTGQAFQVVTPNLATSLAALSLQTVEWNVAGTTSNGIDTATVDILLSTDGGLTFDTLLASDIPNDGQHAVVLPDIRSSTARIKVQARGNVFFDVSNSNFSIVAPQPGIVALESEGSTLIAEGNLFDSYQVRLGSVPDGPVTVSATSTGQTEISTDGVNFFSSLDLTFVSSTPQTVIVRAIDDMSPEGLHMGLVNHAVIATTDPGDYPLSRVINDVVPSIADNDFRRLERVEPLGGLVSRSGKHVGRLGADGIAEFDLPLEADQTISIVLAPSSQGSLAAEIVGISGLVSNQLPGQQVVLPPAVVTTAGQYTLRVTGDGPADFDFEMFSNTDLEIRQVETSDGNELPIDDSAINLGGRRFAVIGRADVTVTTEPHFVKLNDPTAFVDISGTGTPLGLADDGHSLISTSVGNSIFPAGPVTVGNNGAIVAGGSFPTIPFDNGEMPAATFGNALVPFWDDLVGPTPGNVYWEERQVDGIQTLLVQWHQRLHFDAIGSGGVTFQVQVFQTGPVLAKYVYADVIFGSPDVDAGVSATIGYQRDSFSAVPYSLNSASLTNGDILELRLTSPDEDEFELELTDGQSLDIIFTGMDGTDFSAQTVELLGPNGTHQATAVSDPVFVNVDASNYDLGISGFVVPTDGVYTVRVRSAVGGDYGIVLAESVTLESEPNDTLGTALRQISPDQPALGYLDGGTAADQFDLYFVELAAGERLVFETTTVFDGSSLLPANDLDPQLEILDENGVALLATDLDSASDGKNASVDFTAPTTSTYLVRVGATSGKGEYLLTAAIPVDPEGLFLTSFLAIRSGFIAEFSEDLDIDGLNLYDSAAAQLGAPDMTVTGLSTGPVAGSLVVDESRRRVTFIKSGGPLLDDSYDVVLRSGIDGFRSLTGNLLDGNEDGVGGDDFVGSVTTSDVGSAITVSIPDFVRGPGQAVDLPADLNVGIPVTLSETGGVGAVDLRIAYDPELLQITSASVASAMPTGASVVLNQLTPGLAIIVFFSPVSLPAGSNPIVNLSATVPSSNGSAIYGRSQVLDVHGITISDGNDNEFLTIDDDAVHLASYFGDVSGNGRINASDAAQVARIAALLDTGFAAAPQTDPAIIGDVSGNGRLNASDASLLAQFAALLPVDQIPPIPAGRLGTSAFGITSGSNTSGDFGKSASAEAGREESSNRLTANDAHFGFSTRLTAALDQRAIDSLLADEEWFEPLPLRMGDEFDALSESEEGVEGAKV